MNTLYIYYLPVREGVWFAGKGSVTLSSNYNLSNLKNV